MQRVLATTALVLLAAGCASSHRAAATATTSPSTATTARTTTAAEAPKAQPSPAQVALGLPPLPPGPVPGYLMIADRNNGRILILNPHTKKIVWRYTGLPDPDDAFFTPGYRGITINEEFDQTMGEIDLRRHRLVWAYGHHGSAGSAPGYLSNPDDAYLLPDGLFMVADIKNCRVLFVSRAKKVVRELGHAGSCGHRPPQGLSSPNGATPLHDGGVLVTEIGGWVDRISKDGKLLWSIRTPTSYPSDAQLLPDGNVLVAGFNTPGRVDEITPAGKVLWTFAPSGRWSLDRPSLAVRWPNGNVAITDDWHHRVLVVHQATKKVVWSYGRLNSPGSSAGYLNKPDGLDLLPAGTASAPASAPAAKSEPARSTATTASAALKVRRVGSLPGALSKSAAVALPGGRLLVLGGEAGGASTDRILAGPPSRLRPVGHLPVASHDGAAAILDGSVYVFGGGQAASANHVFRVAPATGAAATAAPLDEPLSDLGAAVIGGRAYLVGGYTGSRYASAVLRYLPRGGTKTVARLPDGTRYAGVAAIGSTIFVAGGVTTAGTSDAIYAVHPGGAVRRIGALPQPVAHAALAAAGGSLYLVGGQSASGQALSTVLRIDPTTGRASVAAHLPRALVDPAAVGAGGTVLVVGGAGSDAVYALSPR